jgi:phosphatidylserine decarboxylase
VDKRFLRTKFEQYRQASDIHGGVVRLFVATLGVKLSRVKIPSKRLRLFIFRTVYGKKYSALDEAQFEKPMWEYRSLNALFTRGVRPQYRPISEASGQFLCPCDGRVQEVGRIKPDQLITVKAIDYTLESLLPGIDSRRFQGGHFGVFFLSPSDCHRVFSPQDARVEEVIHVPGYRLLVHPQYQKRDYPVFSLNERMILRLSTPLGECILVLVAGWGVGHITLPFDRLFRPKARKLTRTRYANPVVVTKGGWVATFELGSTAILITEPSDLMTTLLVTGKKVNYGEPAFAFGE